MIIKLKNLHDAAIRSIHSQGKYKRYDKLSERNDRILKYLFSQIKIGEVKMVSLIDETRFHALHKSPKQDGYVQYSIGYWKDGELIPLMDHQFKEVGELLREGCPSGLWNIRKE